MPVPRHSHDRGRTVAGAGIVLLWAGSVFAQSGAPADPTAQITATRTVIEEAIGLGVPLYNDGQTEACAAIYRIALRSLLLLASPSAEQQQEIEGALDTAARQDPQRGAWTLRRALDAMYLSTERVVLMDDDPFRLDFTDRTSRWYVVNDNVMGGVSRGGLTVPKQGTGSFAGQLSMRNNGGFSSVRTQIPGAALAGYDGIEMRVRGDGRRYTLLAAPSQSRGAWQGDFRTTQAWQTIRVPFDEMALSIRGWRPPTSQPLRGGDVGMLGLMVADKQTQPFRLEVDWIRGYSNEVATTP